MVSRGITSPLPSYSLTFLSATLILNTPSEEGMPRDAQTHCPVCPESAHTLGQLPYFSTCFTTSYLFWGVCMYKCRGIRVEVREQLLEVCSLLPTMWVWRQTPFPTELSSLPKSELFVCSPTAAVVLWCLLSDQHHADAEVTTLNSKVF